MKTVGIIGGLGPETTARFYLKIVFNCYRKNKVNRPPIFIWNVPLKYKIEEDLLKKALGETRYIPYLIEAAKRLESAGADFLVMPCNSLHIFIEKIRKSVSIPVLSIVEETAIFLKNKEIRAVGILATSALLKHKLYANALEKERIKYILPAISDQEKIGTLINDIVLNRHAGMKRKELCKIIDKFKNVGLKTVILACTDLQLLNPSSSKLTIYDTMEILVEATIEKILNKTTKS